LPCLLAHARPALPPPSPSPLLIVSCSRDTRILFLVISFLFVSPFCGSTKRLGPFVLPQKGRPVPSLFLFYLSADFRSLVLRPPPGAISVDRASSGFGYGGGIWVYYEFRPKEWMNSTPFLHKTTSKTCPPYNRLLPAASAHFAPGPVDTSSLVPLPQWFFDCRGLWTRVLAMVPCFVPCPLKLGLWTGLFVCSFARGALAGCM